MKTFEIMKLKNESYPYIVLSTSFINPLDEIETIETLLKGYTGKVIFDLLLSNGLSSNRFFEADFADKQFKYSSIKTIKSIDNSIKEQISMFYKNNILYLNNVVLSETDKSLVMNF